MKTLLPLFLMPLALAACAAQIGDACTTNADCGAGRICDRSQPGGYCTLAACDRVECPAESVCVDFGNQTRYCMQKCGAFAFCRDDFVCVLDFPQPDNPDRTYTPFCNQAPVPEARDVVEPPGDDGTP